MDSPSLTVKTVKASIWRLSGFGISNVLRLGSNLVMARLLLPEDFGLMAIVFTLQVGIALSMDIGIATSIVRSDHGEKERFLRTAWTVQIIQCALIFVGLLGVVLFLHLYSGRFFDDSSVFRDPSLPGLIVFSGISVLAQGFQTVNVALAQRRMVLDKIIVSEIASQVISIASMLSIALYQPTVWALAVGAVIGSVTKTILCHLILPGPRMSLCWERAYIAEIWNFGKWLIASSLLWFLASQGDRLVLGGLFNSKEFGVFAIAMIWIGALKTVIRVTGPIGLSALSEVKRERPQDLVRVMRKLRFAQDLICISSTVFVLFAGAWLISLLYPAAYSSAGRFMVLSAVSIALMRYGPLGSLLLAFGKSREVSLNSLLSAITIFTVVPVAFHFWGSYWAVFFVAVNFSFSIPVLFYQSSKIIKINLIYEYVVLIFILLLFILYNIYFDFLNF